MIEMKTSEIIQFLASATVAELEHTEKLLYIVQQHVQSPEAKAAVKAGLRMVLGEFSLRAKARKLN